jgi:hypothetical protein
MESFAISFLLPASYLLIGAGLGIALFFAVKRMGVNIKRTKRTLIGIGGLLVFVLIGYLTASGSNEYFDSFGISESQEKWIETGLFITYVTAFIAIASILLTEIKAVVKK